MTKILKEFWNNSSAKKNFKKKKSRKKFLDSFELGKNSNKFPELEKKIHENLR